MLQMKNLADCPIQRHGSKVIEDIISGLLFCWEGYLRAIQTFPYINCIRPCQTIDEAKPIQLGLSRKVALKERENVFGRIP